MNLSCHAVTFEDLQDSLINRKKRILLMCMFYEKQYNYLFHVWFNIVGKKIVNGELQGMSVEVIGA
jgi:hypothetical protein